MSSALGAQHVVRRTQVYSARGRWRLTALIVSNLAAVTLLGSWLWPPTRLAWDALDHTLFHVANGTLAWGKPWQYFWAFCNWRPFDAIAGSLFIPLVWASVRQSRSVSRTRATVSLVVVFGTAFLFRFLISEGIINSGLGYYRPSPTVVHTDAIRLSELVPNIKAKDSSPWSFPGDHGFVLCTLSLYLMCRARTRVAVIGVLLAVVLCLPRIVSGAHWATDILVGSGTIAIAFAGWFLATPFHDEVVRDISRLVEYWWPAVRPIGDRRGT